MSTSDILLRVVLFFLLAAPLHAGTFNRALLHSSPEEYRITENDSLSKPVIRDSWFSRDKGLHFSGSLILAAGMSNVHHRFGESSKREAIRTGAAITLLVGIGKELFDSTRVNNHFSYKDLSYDIFGILIAGVLIQSD